jgi:transposase
LHLIREILNAIFYVVRSGCAWRLLPHEFPAWQTAYHYFRLWRLDRTWEHLKAALREQHQPTVPRSTQTQLFIGLSAPLLRSGQSGPGHLKASPVVLGQFFMSTGRQAAVSNSLSFDASRPARPRGRRSYQTRRGRGQSEEMVLFVCLLGIIGRDLVGP